MLDTGAVTLSGEPRLFVFKLVHLRGASVLILIRRVPPGRNPILRRASGALGHAVEAIHAGLDLVASLVPAGEVALILRPLECEHGLQLAIIVARRVRGLRRYAVRGRRVVSIRGAAVRLVHAVIRVVGEGGWRRGVRGADGVGGWRGGGKSWLRRGGVVSVGSHDRVHLLEFVRQPVFGREFVFFQSQHQLVAVFEGVIVQLR